MRHIAVALAVVGAMSVAPMPIAQAASVGTVLHDFRKTEGSNPLGRLLRDSTGAFYGTTQVGGQYNDGTVFKLTPPAAGATHWTSTTLYSFSGTTLATADGKVPVAGVIMDAAGNLFGTTQNGGQTGYGTVFELSPPKAGQTAWTETILDDFATSVCERPSSELIMDGKGALYVTVPQGGPAGGGCVLKLTPPAGQGGWTESVLHYFYEDENDGRFAYSGLVADAAGNLYGATSAGGTLGFGTVYELSPPPVGQTQWTEAVLYSFTGYAPGDGSPDHTLIFDPAGALYGTTDIGGNSSNEGTVFKLTPPSGSQAGWTHTVLFGFDGTDGRGSSSLYRNAAGALFSTSLFGGSNGDGLIYELTPPAAGQGLWTQTILYSFTGGLDGSNPSSTLIPDSAGNLYSTTNEAGRACSCGGVYELFH